MKNVYSILIIVIFFIAIPYVIAAENTPPPEEKKWADQAELSYVETTGNTETESFSGKNLLKYQASSRLQFEWEAGALYSESDEVKSAEKYYSELRMDYLFTKQFYTSLIAGWERDEFAVKAKYYIGPAVGYKILTGPKHFWNAESGCDYVFEEYLDDEEDTFLQGRVFTKYEYKLTKKNTFAQSFEYLSNLEKGDDYSTIAITSITASLTDALSLKASYEVKYDHLPIPEELEDTDTTLTVTLVINF